MGIFWCEIFLSSLNSWCIVFWSRALNVEYIIDGKKSVSKVLQTKKHMRIALQCRCQYTDVMLQALVPLVDILNHRPGALSHWSTKTVMRHTVPPEAGCTHCSSLRLVAGTHVSAGAQVFINYGAKGNHELLLYYGFVVPDNPANVFKLDLRSLHVYEILMLRIIKN